MRPFVASDLTALAAWYEARGQHAPTLESLPATGFIEPGVAAGFAYFTDSTLVLLGGMVTNPAAGLRPRARAVADIADALMAKAAGRLVLALSMSPGIARHAVRRGLSFVGMYGVFGGLT